MTFFFTILITNKLNITVVVYDKTKYRQKDKT